MKKDYISPEMIITDFGDADILTGRWTSDGGDEGGGGFGEDD